MQLDRKNYLIGDFIQPTGAHDAYNTGDRVMFNEEPYDMVLFNGKVYESIINGNTWSPIDYPQGWKLID